MIDGKTVVCGLLGNPVEHTLSPAIHNTLAESTGINLVYVPFRVDADRVGDAVRGAWAMNMLGLNVTVPHKSAVIPWLDDVDREAALIGAVNTLVRTPEGFKGYNTDLPGLYRALLSEGISIEGEKIILLGAGGAARAAAFLCALRGAEKVYLLNRSLEKAEQVAEEINRKVPFNGNFSDSGASGSGTSENGDFGSKTAQEAEPRVIPMALSDWRRIPQGRYLAIQGTSVGLAPHSEEAVIMEKEFYSLIHTGFDLVYRPADTRFMQLVREAGGRAYNGLKMLLYQGVESYELWNGIQVTPGQAQKCLELLQKEC